MTQSCRRNRSYPPSFFEKAIRTVMPVPVVADADDDTLSTERSADFNWTDERLEQVFELYDSDGYESHPCFFFI